MLKYLTLLEAEAYNQLVWQALKDANPSGFLATRWADVIERNGAFYILAHENFIPENAVFEQLPSLLDEITDGY